MTILPIALLKITTLLTIAIFYKTVLKEVYPTDLPESIEETFTEVIFNSGTLVYTGS